MSTMLWVVPLTIFLVLFGLTLVVTVTWFFRRFVKDLNDDDANPDTFILIHTAKFEDYDFFDNITDVWREEKWKYLGKIKEWWVAQQWSEKTLSKGLQVSNLQTSNENLTEVK